MKTRTVFAPLGQSANYRQVLELCPCDAVSSLMELRISSTYLDAKNPDNVIVRFQTMVTRDELAELKHQLNALDLTSVAAER